MHRGQNRELDNGNNLKRCDLNNNDSSQYLTYKRTSEDNMGDHSVHGHAEELPKKQEEAGSAMQNHGDSTPEPKLIDGRQEAWIYNIGKKELDLLLLYRGVKENDWLAVTEDILPMGDIKKIVKRVMNFEDIQERRNAFELLYSLCDESAAHGTFPDLTRTVCTSFLELPPDVSCKALPLLIDPNHDLFHLFILECKPHYAEILDWVSSMPVANQKQFWGWAHDRGSDETIQLLRLFNVGEWKQLFSMMEVIQPKFAKEQAFNAWVVDLSIQLSNHCEKTAKSLLRQYAGDLAADMLDWLQKPDQAKWTIFDVDSDASLPIFELRVHNNLPKIQLYSTDGLKYWYDYAVVKKIDTTPWSVQDIMQLLFQCADNRTHKTFLFDWLERLDINDREIGNSIRWKPGGAWVIAVLLRKVIEHKIGLDIGLHKRKHEEIYTDESEEASRKRHAVAQA